eukprot:3505494-Karenia_brevis.AAC.1
MAASGESPYEEGNLWEHVAAGNVALTFPLPGQVSDVLRSSLITEATSRVTAEGIGSMMRDATDIV